MMKMKSGSKKKIYNIAPDMHYYNEHLMKDCCQLPYIYGRMYGYETVIITVKSGEYDYLKYMPDVIMQYMPEQEDIIAWTELCKEYIKQNINECDILYCFGIYYVYMDIVPLYKKLRPDGKVILKMDANAAWVDNMSFGNKLYSEFLKNCDYIGCECKKIKELLASKLPYKIEYLPNGFPYRYNHIKCTYDDKQNTILYVGRVGDVDKQNQILLEAFARCAHMIPDWKLKLIGVIEDEFEYYIEEYFIKYPFLKGRVIFTGKIIDKQKLYNEYSCAKVFALTSKKEGGTPNVFGEAAAYGCYIICSDIDGSGDMTNWGTTGSVFPIGDIEALSDLLVKICNKEKTDSSFFKNKFESIQQYAEYYCNYNNIIKRVHYIQKKKKND